MYIWEILINFFGRKKHRDSTRAGTANGKACTASAKKPTDLSVPAQGVGPVFNRIDCRRRRHDLEINAHPGRAI
jgi:hypothetical protein